MNVTLPPSATRRAAACASSFGLPTTKLSKVQRPSSGEAGRSTSVPTSEVPWIAAVATAGGESAGSRIGAPARGATPNSSRLTVTPFLQRSWRMASPKLRDTQVPMKAVGAASCTTPWSDADEDQGIDPVLEGVLAELSHERAAHAGPGVGRGIHVVGEHLGCHLGS